MLTNKTVRDTWRLGYHFQICSALLPRAAGVCACVHFIRQKNPPLNTQYSMFIRKHTYILVSMQLRQYDPLTILQVNHDAIDCSSSITQVFSTVACRKGGKVTCLRRMLSSMLSKNSCSSAVIGRFVFILSLLHSTITPFKQIKTSKLKTIKTTNQ